MYTRYIFVLLLPLALACACGQSDSSGPTVARPLQFPTARPGSTPRPVVTTTTGHYLTVDSMQEQIARSPVIVIGEVVGLGGIFNGSRNVEDRTQPSQSSFAIQQVYRVRALRYVKGSGPESININQFEGAIDADPATITQADLDQLRASYPYTPLHPGVTYLFFLQPFEGVDIEPDSYTGAYAHPWRFILSADGRGVGEAPPDAPQSIPLPDPAAPLLPQVEQLVRAEQQR